MMNQMTVEDAAAKKIRVGCQSWGYDDWVTPTITRNGHQMHGLNGDILVWNPVTHRRHELSSM